MTTIAQRLAVVDKAIAAIKAGEQWSCNAIRFQTSVDADAGETPAEKEVFALYTELFGTIRPLAEDEDGEVADHCHIDIDFVWWTSCRLELEVSRQNIRILMLSILRLYVAAGVK